MTSIVRLFALAAFCPFLALPPGAAAQTIIPLGNGSFQNPGGIALDSAGNLFVTDTGNNTVKELTIASGYAAVTNLAPTTGAFNNPSAVALDRNNNVFVADQGNAVVKELLAPDYQTVRIIAPGAGTQLTPGSGPIGIAVDSSSNLFISGFFSNSGAAPFAEIPAAGGYDRLIVLPVSFLFSTEQAGLTIDAAGNLFAATPTSGFVLEVLAAGGYSTTTQLGDIDIIDSSSDVALDGAGNLFVAGFDQTGTRLSLEEITAASGFETDLPIATPNANFGNLSGVVVAPNGTLFVSSDQGVVDEILLTPAPLEASILPGSRAVVTGAPATIFATMINSNTMIANDCQVELPAISPPGLSLTYQTTDPATNVLTGSADTPVSIAPGGFQTFLLSFTSTDSLMASNLAPMFRCNFAMPAAVAPIPGVNTVDLLYNFNATADVIALEQVASADAILHIPTGGGNAFAIATANAGAGAMVTVSADTGSAALPLAMTLCNSNPMNGQCLAPAAASVSLSIDPGATPTFSVFASAGAAIPVNPAASRIFVRFLDQNGNLVGSTSVAVSSP